MILLKKAEEATSFLSAKKNNGVQIGFVPTMGALHQGHLSLIQASKKQNTLTICSIFVNPTQFNDPSDLEKYPITIEQDIYLLEKAGCDVLFLPSVKEMYPSGIKGLEHYNIGYLETVLEGRYRPGHFQGVCQVVHRLLDILQPDNLYLGQKDQQQCLVIKKMIELTGLPTQSTICPTLREASGLAMSSRNMRLSDGDKAKATELYTMLLFIKKELIPGDLSGLKERAIDYLSARNFKVDYVEIADTATLQPVDNWDGTTSLIALAAAFLNEVRLIDNLLLN